MNTSTTSQTRVGRNERDAAVAAWLEVLRAGENDAAYGQAIESFENAKPTSPAGVEAQFDLLWRRIESVIDVEDMPILSNLAAGIAEGLAHLRRKAG